MSLLPKATLLAAELSGIHSQFFSFARAMAKRSYEIATTPGEQQAVMTVLNDEAAGAVITYAAIYQMLASLGQAGDLAAPDTTVFQIQTNGTVLYVAPPIPEQPIPDPEPPRPLAE